MRTLHLFAGAGGGLLADLILGHDPVCAVEWDPYCCQVLRERAAEGWFPGLHVFEGDVRVFNAYEWKGRVDCIHAGFPCQDISIAGKRAGVDEGTRSGLYREVLRCADEIRPKFLFLENVSAILSNGLGTVLGDLASRGYDCRWCCLRASDVGAPHQRDRWWCLAYAKGERTGDECEDKRKGRHKINALDNACGGRGGNDQSKDRAALADAGRKYEPWDTRKLDTDTTKRAIGILHAKPGGSGSNVADTTSAGRGRLSIGETQAHAEPGQFGWWEIEPDLGRVAHGVASRVDRLKGLGNGQVPLQAALAFKILMGDK